MEHISKWMRWLRIRPWYLTRNNEIATNVLGVCTQNMKFIYVLTKWEGSANSRILRDVIFRTNGLRVPKGNGFTPNIIIYFLNANLLLFHLLKFILYLHIDFYYLCDAGYRNGEGFLALYKAKRYHLNEWTE